MRAPAPPLSRRRVLAGTGLAVVSALLPRAAHGAADGFRILRAHPGSARLRGPDQPPTAVWGYDGTVPGPVLRVRRGEELRVRLVNELPEETVIHWHGLRLPNAMDGVPHLTQHPVAPGQSFDYRFVVPDAGTFWYHSHRFSSEQQERGLYGGLIVEEPAPVDVDRDVLLILDDWRLTPEGANDEASFRSFHDAAHAGRLGRHFTVNGGPTLDLPVRANERIRLRLVNAANARVMPLRLERLAARVMAIDGQPAEPFLARESRLTLGPGNRADLFVDATLEPGASAALILEDVRAEVPLVRLVTEGPPARAAPRGEPPPLPANPLPERMNFPAALRIDLPLEGGAMSPLMMRRGEVPGHGIDPAARIWTMAGQASSGHDGPPLFSAKRGRTVVIAMPNRTAFPHAMHLHGHHFRLLDNLDDGWKPFWLDTVVIDRQRTARIAFVADNPGKWMIHCHMLEHQETGMAAWFEVT
ncbi:MAG: multicopper oxidase family protein [Xanthobacteraceae bacterium]|nr:multicopper oxidase family protein [Xanthobacteraceae bacterium]PWB65459.1 MAG: copper oxidase [Bradyrhizobiaceae bacterium]